MSKLEEVNERLKLIEIDGKKYAPVTQRILGFHELYPAGRIVTEKIADNGTRCDFKASVFDGDTLIATGHSFEFQNQGMVNKTSYVENAETSAVGRALGMLGIGIAESLASADEVQAAIEHQERGEAPARNQPQRGRPKPRPQTYEQQATEQLDPLQQAQSRLLAVEREYCSRHGIDDWGEFHRNVVMKRPDYQNTQEALDAIADELGNA